MLIFQGVELGGEMFSSFTGLSWYCLSKSPTNGLRNNPIPPWGYRSVRHSPKRADDFETRNFMELGLALTGHC